MTAVEQGPPIIVVYDELPAEVSYSHRLHRVEPFPPTQGGTQVSDHRSSDGNAVSFHLRLCGCMRSAER
jgi:hypothetical protein